MPAITKKPMIISSLISRPTDKMYFYYPPLHWKSFINQYQNNTRTSKNYTRTVKIFWFWCNFDIGLRNFSRTSSPMTDIQYTCFRLQVIPKICTAFASAKFMTNCRNMNFPTKNLKNSRFCATKGLIHQLFNSWVNTSIL